MLRHDAVHFCIKPDDDSDWSAHLRELGEVVQVTFVGAVVEVGINAYDRVEEGVCERQVPRVCVNRENPLSEIQLA